MSIRSIFAITILCVINLSCGDSSRPFEPIPYPTPDRSRIMTEDEVAKIETHRGTNRELVRRCVSSGGKTGVAKVAYRSSHFCKEGEPPRGSTVRFRISPASDGLANVRLHLGVNAGGFDSTSEERDELVSIVSECIPTVKQYFERSGIHLDFTLERFGSAKKEHVDGVVSIDRGWPSDPDPFSSSSWYVYPGMKHTDRDYCDTITHEVGHLLGGPDEYLDLKRCPDREFISDETFPWSMMSSSVGMDRTDFYPRHIEGIIRPLCEDLALEEGWPLPEGFSFKWL